MKNRERRIVWFAGLKHVVPQDFESWMEKMAADGWLPEQVGQWSSIRMVFHRREPGTYRYVYDLQAFPREEYRPTYESFGWEYLGRMSSIYLWRKAYTGERPEAFSDAESLARRGKRVYAAVSVSFWIFLVAAVCLLLGLILGRGRSAADLYSGAFCVALLLLCGRYLAGVLSKLKKGAQLPKTDQ